VVSLYFVLYGRVDIPGEGDASPGLSLVGFWNKEEK
jgi:hypothetical protein